MLFDIEWWKILLGILTILSGVFARVNWDRFDLSKRKRSSAQDRLDEASLRIQKATTWEEAYRIIQKEQIKTQQLLHALRMERTATEAARQHEMAKEDARKLRDRERWARHAVTLQQIHIQCNCDAKSNLARLIQGVGAFSGTEENGDEGPG